MANVYIVEGSVARFITDNPAFTSISGTIIDPDVVTFTYQPGPNQPTTTYTWTNPTGDPTNHIQKQSTGVFYVDLDTSGLPGNWIWKWHCYPSSGTDTTATQVTAQGYVQVVQTTI